MSTVATAPRPLSRLASIATPRASLLGLARKSSPASAVSSTASSSVGDADVVERRDVDEHRVSAVLLGDETVLGELLSNLRRVGAVLVDLVDRDDDRHIGSLRVVESLNRLRHDAVVGRDHEDRDVGNLGTSSTHGGERLVTRGVNEGDGSLDAFVLAPHLVCTDVLGDTTGLAGDDVGLPDGVEELASFRGRRDP